MPCMRVYFRTYQKLRVCVCVYALVETEWKTITKMLKAPNYCRERKRILFMQTSCIKQTHRQSRNCIDWAVRRSTKINQIVHAWKRQNTLGKQSIRSYFIVIFCFDSTKLISNKFSFFNQFERIANTRWYH